MKIDDVIDKLVDLFKEEASLSDILTYHKVNGILPDIGTSLSVGCDKVKFSDYSNSLDEANAEVNVFVYTQEPDPEYGEKVIRNLAENVRYCLTENLNLEGTISASTVEEIEYIYADADETAALHAAVIRYKPQYYQERRRPKTAAVPVEAVKPTLERS